MDRTTSQLGAELAELVRQWRDKAADLMPDSDDFLGHDEHFDQGQSVAYYDLAAALQCVLNRHRDEL